MQLIIHMVTNCIVFLYVSDTPSNLKMLQRLLLQKGVKSEGAINGLEATFLYEKRKKVAPSIKLIFMDYTMPIMVRESIVSALFSHDIHY